MIVSNTTEIDWTGFLQRPLFTPSCQGLDHRRRNKTILITGTGGSIGSALATKLMDELECRLILLDNSEAGLDELHRKFRARTGTASKVEFVQADIRSRAEVRAMFSAANNRES